MKTAVCCVVCALGAFVAMHFTLTGQLGDFDYTSEGPSKKPPAGPARFPEALAPAARGEGVPQAAAFLKSAETHPSVVLARSGRLHPWHERLLPDWSAETVETTELVLVVGKEQKTLLQVVTYPPVGAAIPPPVRRYRYDLDAWLVEARTGETVASKRFVSIARSIRPRENWDLTELGDPIQWVDLAQWMRAMAAAHSGREVLLAD